MIGKRLCRCPNPWKITQFVSACPGKIRLSSWIPFLPKTWQMSSECISPRSKPPRVGTALPRRFARKCVAATDTPFRSTVSLPVDRPC